MKDIDFYRSYKNENSKIHKLKEPFFIILLLVLVINSYTIYSYYSKIRSKTSKEIASSIEEMDLKKLKLEKNLESLKLEEGSKRKLDYLTYYEAIVENVPKTIKIEEIHLSDDQQEVIGLGKNREDIFLYLRKLQELDENFIIRDINQFDDLYSYNISIKALED